MGFQCGPGLDDQVNGGTVLVVYLEGQLVYVVGVGHHVPPQSASVLLQEPGNARADARTSCPERTVDEVGNLLVAEGHIPSRIAR